MRDAARLQAAIEILEAVLTGAPADRAMHHWGRHHRFAGSKDRAAIADRVYLCLRRLRSLSWSVQGTGEPSARAAVIGSVLAAGVDPAGLFDGQRHGPAPLTGAETQAIAAGVPPPPDPVRLDYPDWLDGHLRESLRGRFEGALTALQERAPLDLRVNLRRVSLEEAAHRLAAEGIETVPVPGVPTALRTRPGAPVRHGTAYGAGLIELQDAASQAAAAVARALPGETVLDFCAGGGGKALALADAMGGTGRVIAHDAVAARMSDLPARAARAGVRIERLETADLAALDGKCDLVFVDAPCSGTGSWRRDPGGKWRLTEAGLASLVERQQQIVAEASRYLAPDGRLVFCLCSVLNVEAEAGSLAMGRPPGSVLKMTPDDGSDGFYCASW